MGVITLRPDAVVTAGGWTNSGGGIVACLGDDSDASYAQAPASGANLTLGLADLTTLPAGARITSVAFRVRRGGDNAANFALVAAYSSSTQYLANGEIPSSIATGSYFPMASAPGGAPWSTTTVNGLQLRIWGSSDQIRVYEVYCDVTYDAPPTATILGPVGTVTNTQYPPVSWAYADAEGGLQERVQVLYYSAATVAEPGFQVAVTPAIWGTLAITTAAVLTPIYPVTVPGDYVTYLRVAEQGGDFGAWAVQPWVMGGSPPAVPLLAAVPDDAGRRIVLTLTQQDNRLGYRQASAEGGGSDQAGWYAAGNCTMGVGTTTASGAEGAAVHVMTTLAAGPAAARGGGAWQLHTGPAAVAAAPVEGGVPRTLVGQVWQTGNVARSCRIDVDWRAEDGSYLGTTEGTPVTTSTIGAMTQISQDVTPPADAVAAMLVLVAVDPAASGELFHWDRIGLMPLGVGWNRGGFTVSNWFGPNAANADLALSGWTQGAGGTLTRVTGEATPSGAAMQVVLTAATSTSTSGRFPVATQDQITIFALGRKSELSLAAVRVAITFYDSSGVQLQYSASDATDVTPLANKWTLVSATLDPPAGAVEAEMSLFSVMESSIAGRWVRWSRVGWVIGPLPPVWQPGPRAIARPLLEFSDDGGASWSYLRGAQDGRFSPNGFAVVYDYEAPPGRARLYRAHTAVTDYALSSSGAELVSEASATASAVQRADGWWLKDPTSPGLMLRLQVAGSISSTSPVPATVYAPLSRAHKVVLSDVPLGEEFDLNLIVKGAEDWATFAALRAGGVTLLLQSDYGDQWYVALMDRDMTLMSSVSRRLEPVRMIKVKAVEVDSPPDVSRY